MGVAERVMLVSSLLHGVVNRAEQRAIVALLEDAATRGELRLIVGLVGGYRLRFSLDGAEISATTSWSASSAIGWSGPGTKSPIPIPMAKRK